MNIPDPMIPPALIMVASSRESTAPVKPGSKPVSVSGFQLDSGFSARVSALNSRSLTLFNHIPTHYGTVRILDNHAMA
jgi:hypothetical protein